MKNITLSADEDLIEAARARARAEHTTLNAEFRRWLEQYSGRADRVAAHRALMEQLDYIDLKGRKLTRDEMNER